MRVLWMILSVFLLFGCLGMPDKVQPVDEFVGERYLGRWYEIARLDHPFERGLEQVTAEYSWRDDGGIRVVNRGYSTEDNEWEQSEGKAYFVEGDNLGYLKVSFFGPFYGSYVVFELEKEGYEYAFFSGPNNSYLWLLARTPEVSQGIKDKFVVMSNALGFSTADLIFVNQSYK